MFLIWNSCTFPCIMNVTFQKLANCPFEWMSLHAKQKTGSPTKGDGGIEQLAHAAVFTLKYFRATQHK